MRSLTVPRPITITATFTALLALALALASRCTRYAPSFRATSTFPSPTRPLTTMPSTSLEPEILEALKASSLGKSFSRAGYDRIRCDDDGKEYFVKTGGDFKQMTVRPPLDRLSCGCQD